MLHRTALAGDRPAVATMTVGAFFIASVTQQQGASGSVWAWCGACVTLACLRLLISEPRRWLAMLFLTCAVWGVGPAWFLFNNPSADTLLTAMLLAVAGLSAPLVAASRSAVYLSLLPALVPVLLTLTLRPSAGALSSSATALLLAGLALAFLVVLLRLTLDQNDSLTLLLAVSLRNEDLVQQLRSQIDVVAHAHLEKTRFLASAAHDLRQPLHALGMFCSALQRRLPNTPEQPLVRNMMSAIEALETSFSAMLDISRFDAGLVHKAPRTFPIRDIFRRLYQQFGGDAEARNLALRFRATRRIVHSDPLLLERVLGNLVQNALRYTRQGGVLVAARRHCQGVALEIWDTGVGIPSDQKDMIFQEFYQIDNPERDRGRGLGMGLAIVQRLCNLLEHRLEMHSKFGHGSVFRVLVPAGEADAIDATPTEADTLPPRRQGMVTVMLIDDERAIREATRELLRPLQVNVLVAATIAEAVDVAKAAQQPIDLIMSDWRLRAQENGVAAIQALRCVAGEATPAVLITGDTSPELLQLAHESGLVILHKPLQPRHLVRLVKHLRR
jgi:signal transduction histidine kinase/CheY-like chemotaxis protein